MSEFDHEQQLASELESMGWQYVDKREYSVEVFMDSGSFFKFVSNVQKLKNEYSFILHVKYDTMGKTLATFENIYYFKSN